MSIFKRETRGQEWYKTEYLKSEWWEKLKKQVLKNRPYICQIGSCDKTRNLEFHHLRYDRMKTIYEHLDVVIVCHTHHHKCHYRLLGLHRVPLTKPDLIWRYRELSQAPIIKWYSTILYYTKYLYKLREKKIRHQINLKSRRNYA